MVPLTRSDVKFTFFMVASASFSSCVFASAGSSLRFMSLESGCVDATMYVGTFLTYALNRARTMASGVTASAGAADA